MPEEVPAAAPSTEPGETGVSEIHNKTSFLAEKLTDWVDAQGWVPNALNHTVAISILLLGLLIASALLYLVFRPLILRIVSRLVHKTEFTWDNELVGHGVFRWLTHLLPGILIYLAAPGLFVSAPWLASALHIVSSVYILITCYFVFDSLLNSLQVIISQTPAGKRLNLATFTQVAKLVGALVVIILTIAILIGKSPLTLLGGLGVFASVFMLVFKDVILGFVAGIQLASNQMLSQGDWLEMPSYNADGDVLEIGLTTVKVQNWDKTITTIPTYALISDSFKNWRGMSESGGRRIKRSLLIDTNTIRLCTDEMLDRFEEIEHISEYLASKKAEVEEFNATVTESRLQNRVNGRRLTNIGTFRAYIEAYLRHHPDINQEMTLLVRQLTPEGRGIPIEIYCFSSNKVWADYESIQADIFDHLLAVAPEFDLRIFQEPTGLDFQSLASE
ncbi:MAG: mechanosensitive ion channel family protein [Verrucomicrobiales bacterium]|nr:mechanosensitive ion channel family protein [Verrucomicrobiales bacterium]